MNDKVLGHCPLCAQKLTRDGITLLCPNGDYQAEEIRFHQIWDTFLELPKEAQGEFENSEKLMRDLLAENLK